MVLAARRREGRCMEVEKQLRVREEAVEHTQKALAGYQADIEQFVKAQAQRQELQRDPTGAAEAHLAAAEQKLKQRQANLLPRVESVQQLEEELRRRTQRVE